jgi:hypothetical protein
MYVCAIPLIFFPFLKSSSSFPYILTLHLFKPHYPLPLQVKLLVIIFSLPYIIVQYILQVFCSSIYVCCLSKASPKFCAIHNGKPPSEGQSLPRAGEEEPDSNMGQLQRSQVCNHWATSPPIHSSHPLRSIFQATTHTPPLSLYCHHRLLLFTPSTLPHSPLLVHSSLVTSPSVSFLPIFERITCIKALKLAGHQLCALPSA